MNYKNHILKLWCTIASFIYLQNKSSPLPANTIIGILFIQKLIYIRLIVLSKRFFLMSTLFILYFFVIHPCKENWIQGGGNRVSVHFAVTFLDCWRTSFCVTTIIKIVNNNTSNKQTSRRGRGQDNLEFDWKCLCNKVLFGWN